MKEFVHNPHAVYQDGVIAAIEQNTLSKDTFLFANGQQLTCLDTTQTCDDAIVACGEEMDMHDSRMQEIEFQREIDLIDDRTANIFYYGHMHRRDFMFEVRKRILLKRDQLTVKENLTQTIVAELAKNDAKTFVVVEESIKHVDIVSTTNLR